MSESSSNANLDYNANTINLAIGWVSGVRPYVSAEEMVQAVTEFQNIKASQTTINSQLTGLTNTINAHTEAINNLNTDYQEADAALDGRIDALEESIAGLDVTVLAGRVTKNEEDIVALNNSVAGVTQRVVSLEGTSGDHGKRLTDAEKNITTLTGELGKQNGLISGNSKEINLNRQAINEHTGQIAKLTADVARHEGDFASVREFGTILYNEIETRASEDIKLSERITNEVVRAGNAEDELLEKIEAEVKRSTKEDEKVAENLLAETQRATEVENALNQSILDEITNRIKEDEALNKKIDKSIEDEQKRSDKALNDAIESEVERANNALNNAIQAEASRIDKALSSAIEEESTRTNQAINNAIENEVNRSNKALDDAVESLSGTISEVSSTASDALAGVREINESYNYIRNDYNEVALKPYVFRIVFLNSEEDYNKLEEKQQGTLYLIREEE